MSMRLSSQALTTAAVSTTRARNTHRRHAFIMTRSLPFPREAGTALGTALPEVGRRVVWSAGSHECHSDWPARREPSLLTLNVSSVTPTCSRLRALTRTWLAPRQDRLAFSGPRHQAPPGPAPRADDAPALRPGVQGDRLPRFHVIEGDEVTGRLAGDTFTGRPHALSGPLDTWVLAAHADRLREALTRGPNSWPPGSRRATDEPDPWWRRHTVAGKGVQRDRSVPSSRCRGRDPGYTVKWKPGEWYIRAVAKATPYNLAGSSLTVRVSVY